MGQKFFSPIFIPYPNFDMENSKIDNIFPCLFTFIFIFDSINQKCPKMWVKNFFNICSWKLPYNLILIWITQKCNSFFQVFSSSFSFLPRLIKNGFKNESKQYFLRFSWKILFNLILIWRIQKSNSFFQIFSSSFSYLPRLVKKVMQNGSKNFFKFSWRLPRNLILIWRTQKPKSFSFIISSSSSFLHWLIKNVLQDESKNFSRILIKTAP